MKQIALIAAAIFIISAGDALAACKGTRITGNSFAMRGGYFDQTQAVSFARQHWKYLCNRRFGASWCLPSKAAARQSLCRLADTPGPDKKYICEFRARPCR